MDGIHDLGGRHGFGGSLAKRDEACFHEPWERRVFSLAMLLMVKGCHSIDAARHAIERLDPAVYLGAGYYGRWLASTELLLRESGGRFEPGRFAGGGAARREIDATPRFVTGDLVRTRNRHPAEHTRLPGYARGKLGRIVLQQGAWVLPDSNAHGHGECPEHAYCVRFEASELWGDDAEPGNCVQLDLFESYLEPA